MARFVAAALAAVLLAGCAELLPTSKAEVRSPWSSFEQARDAIESLQPGRSTTQDLKALGIDPYASPNVQLLTYSDVALRFPVTVGRNHPDPGLRQCLEAGKRCVGYAINVKDIRRDRVGDFWQDAFRFKRVTKVTGWTFNALILLVGDRVVYTLYGGQPNVYEEEVSRQPLGPVQEFGDSVGDLIK